MRHAETEWSRSGRHTGRTDVPLTDEGREAARALRARLAGRAFALVLCSPLLARARDRASSRASALGQLRDDLLEWDYGDYEGITTAGDPRAAPRLVPLARRRARAARRPDDVAARCDRVIAEALRAPSGDVALVAHGHILRALAARWVEAPVAFGGHLHLGTGAISVLAYEREVPVISRWNG